MATCYILGAGASYGAKLQSADLRPPLVREMFRRASTIGGGSSFNRVASWCQARYGISREALISGDPDFESVLGRFDADWNSAGSEATQENIGLGLEREELLELVHEIFIGSTVALKFATCPYHDRLAQSLEAADTVLNFNYDFVMEASLEKGKKLTDYGVGSELMGMTHKWDGQTLTEISGFKANRNDPAHLKLHGSLGWFRRKPFAPYRVDSEMGGARPEPEAPACRIVASRSVCVKPPLTSYGSLRIAPKTFVGVESLLVPPAPIKSGLAGPDWKGLWSYAMDRLRESTKWVSIGYSFRPTDEDVNEMVRHIGTAIGSRLEIEIVAPSDGPEIAKRVKELVPLARVRNCYGTLEKYSESLHTIVG